MKISKQRNHLMVWLTIINIILKLAIFLLHINRIQLDLSLSYFIDGVIEITYILMLLYLIGILQSVGETIAVQTPFSLFLGIEVMIFISGFISSRSQSMVMMLTAIGVVKIIAIFYIAIIVFKVKNQQISVAFKIYGLSLILVFIVKMSMPFLFVMTNHAVSPTLKYLGLTDIIPLIAMLFIIDKAGEYLDSYQIAIVD
jgi:hypothetical protein